MSPGPAGLGGLLDAGGPAPEPATLAAIVARRDRRVARRLRRVAVSATVVAVASLAAGGIGLARATGVGARAARVQPVSGLLRAPVAESLEGAHRGASPVASAAPAAASGLLPLRPLVVQDGSVAVHAYLVTSADPAVASCATPGALVVEAADAGAVAQVVVAPAAGSGPQGFADRLWLVGEAEGTPMVLVVGRAGPRVRRVELTLPGSRLVVAAPASGWVVLGGLVLPPAGRPGAAGPVPTVRVLGDRGRVLRVLRSAVEPAGASPEPACAKLAP